MAERAVIVVTTEAHDIDVPAELTVATADQFLDGRGFTDPDAHVINLCRDTSYGTKGYYVSLLAEARGQMVLPRVETMASLAEPYSRFRVLQEAGASTIDAQEMTVRRRVLEQTGGPPVALADRPPTSFSTPVIFVEPGNLRLPDAHEVVETFVFLGKCRDARFQQIASAVFREFPAPLLRVQIVHEESTWKISQVATLSPRELTAAQLKELGEALRSYRTNSTTRRSRETTRASLAVLLDPGSHFSPSTPETIDRLERVASRMNVHLARLTLQDLRRLPEYDAVFIRAHTSVTHPAFQFAVRAEALGMPVVDATNSTIRCTNKVFIDELLRREAIATPRAIIVKANTSWEEIASIGLPFVLKLPDGDFSAAVHKVATREDYEHYSRQMFKRSALLLAQEWLPTDFDWRIGVLGGQLLFVCKYYMARGHWQIRSVEKGTERYGKVEAVRRDQAPPEIVEIALRAAAMIGDGFYGVDIKETAHGPVVIEVNDNANLDIGYEDAADGDVIYEDIINYFLRKIEAAASTRETGANSEAHLAELRRPIGLHEAQRDSYGLFEVAGLELEYPIVDRDLNVKPLVEPAFRILAGHGASDVDLGAIGFSNEFADHVFELKTQHPVSSFTQMEELLFEGVQRFTAVLRDEFDARLFPTAMHPWFDPQLARLWTRSGLGVYTTYERLFDVRTHGWMNVQASHLNLPFGTETETVAMHNAAALLVPYLPAIAASSPMYDGQLHAAADGRMDMLTRIQSRVPESCGRIVPEFIQSFDDYQRRILQPMYDALDRIPDTSALRHEFFNTRAAILRFSRKALEVRVLDTQECVKMDVAIAAFTRYALQLLTDELLSGHMKLPNHDELVTDFHACIQDGTLAMVRAPHLGGAKRKNVRDVLRHLNSGAKHYAPADELKYLELVDRVIETGSLSERIRSALQPHAEKPADEFSEAARQIYIQLTDCLEANEAWGLG